MKSKVLKTINRLVLLCVVGQVMLILGSWLWAAASPEAQVRSLLSSSGIRWFFGTFTQNMASPLLVWLILAFMAVGSVRSSGVGDAFSKYLSRRRARLLSQQRFAIRSAMVLLLVEIVAVALLTLMPHAVLLSITGELFPSSFSKALVPVLAFMCVTTSIFYGLLSGKFHTWQDVCSGVCSFDSWLMPLLLLYVVGSELWHSCTYVFG